MQVAIELPEDIGQELRAKWQDLPRHALEALALEGYRSGALTESQVRRLLGFDTRWQANSFLRERGVYYNFTPSEMNEEITANEQLLDQPESGRQPR
jgi:hypothetical protein